DGEVPPFVPLLRRKAGPASVDAPAADVAADHQHRVSVSMIGAAVAVLGHRPAELAHRQNDDVAHAIAEVTVQRGDSAAEVVEPRAELPRARALIHVRVPAARFGERDLEADVRPDE